MDFEFENKDDMVFDDSGDTAKFENFNNANEGFGEFEDISSSSDGSGYNFMDVASGPKKKKKNKARIIINSVVSVILAISIIFTSIMGWGIANADKDLQDIGLFKWLFGSGQFGDIMYDDDGLTESGDFEDLKISDNEDVTYFLVVGCDWTSSKQTDVIVVVCMDHKNDTVSMLQIPRDTYVNSGGKINGVYVNAREGELKINALRRCISNELALPIDHYVLFSIEGAVNVVDAVGGVSMNFPSAVRIENPLDFGNYYSIGPGEVRLSGLDAIGFMRKRYGSEEGYETGSDIGRIKQQRKFYSALFKELLGMSTSEVWKVANNCFNQVQTDLSLKETVAFALSCKDLKMEDIHIYGLPGQSCYYNGLSYYSIHKDEYVEIFNKYFNPYGEKITEADVGMTEIYSLAGNSKVESNISTEDSTLNDY